MPEIRSRRLTMRPFSTADIQNLIRLDRLKTTRRFALDDAIESQLQGVFLCNHLKYIDKKWPGIGIWVASLSETEKFIGHFSLMPVMDTEQVELGVKLLPEAHGRMYALEGGRAVCSYGFEEIGLSEIVAFAHPDNRVIPILLRRLGFTKGSLTEHFGHPALRFQQSADCWLQLRSRK